jgi:hypothetical protein
MLETGKNTPPIEPGSPLLTAWWHVETLLLGPSVPNRFGGWSSGKSRIYLALLFNCPSFDVLASLLAISAQLKDIVRARDPSAHSARQ